MDCEDKLPDLENMDGVTEEPFTTVINNKRRDRMASDGSDEQTVLKKVRSEEDNSDYIVYIEGKTKRITELGPDAVSRYINTHFTTVLKIERAGKALRIHCNSHEQKTAILKAGNIVDVLVNCTEPQRINKNITSFQAKIKKIITGVPLDITDEEINNYAKSETATKLKKRINGNLQPKMAVLLTYPTDAVIPTFVQVDYLSFSVKTYIPRPLRCWNCQGYGHSQDHCRRETPKCPQCAEGHKYESCPNKREEGRKCANCGGPHSAGYNGCPKFKTAQDITKLIATTGISYRDAVANTKSQLKIHKDLWTPTVPTTTVNQPTTPSNLLTTSTAVSQILATNHQGRRNITEATHLNISTQNAVTKSEPAHTQLTTETPKMSNYQQELEKVPISWNKTVHFNSISLFFQEVMNTINTVNTRAASGHNIIAAATKMLKLSQQELSVIVKNNSCFPAEQTIHA